jgi:carbon monoxide dehydrogenase subunit G
MKMTGEQRIAAPIGDVWAALNDADVLRASIPGCQSLESDGNNGFKAAATIKVGPISARFGGFVQLSDLDPPRSYRITGEGSGGAAGAAKGGALVRLEEQGEETLLVYDVTADVSGRLAQLGGKLIDVTAKQLAGVFFSRFSDEVLKRQGAAGHATGDAAASPAMPEVARAPASPRPVRVDEAPGSGPGAAGLLLLAAALVAGFVLGRNAAGWDGSGALAGAAIGLLIVLVAAAAFLFGQRPGRAAAVTLDPASIAELAALLGKPRS